MSNISENERRRYAALHALGAEQVLNALVSWDGKSWTVWVNDEVLPDCCDTLEDAFTIAEAEIARRAPDHFCSECRQWHPFDDGAGS